MSELRADTITASDGSSPVTLTKQSAAKAFVDANAAAVILKSFNVSTGTDNGTGDYSYALVSAMDSNNYSMPCCVRTGTVDRNAIRNGSRDSASLMAIETSNSRLNANTDQNQNATLHGDLA